MVVLVIAVLCLVPGPGHNIDLVEALSNGVVAGKSPDATRLKIDDTGDEVWRGHSHRDIWAFQGQEGADSEA